MEKTENQRPVESWDKRWTNPPEAFVKWWNPHSFNIDMGGSVGGHDDARRGFVHPTTKAVAWYGLGARIAWNCQRYQDEWRGDYR